MFHSVSLLSQAPLARGSRALPSVLFNKRSTSEKYVDENTILRNIILGAIVRHAVLCLFVYSFIISREKIHVKMVLCPFHIEVNFVKPDGKKLMTKT